MAIHFSRKEEISVRLRIGARNAPLAQMEERTLGRGEVVGSNLDKGLHTVGWIERFMAGGYMAQ